MVFKRLAWEGTEKGASKTAFPGQMIKLNIFTLLFFRLAFTSCRR